MNAGELPKKQVEPRRTTAEDHVGTAVDVFRGDQGQLVINASGIDLGPISDAVSEQTGEGAIDRQIMSAMASWVGTNGPPASRRVNGIFDRDRYVAPNGVFDLIRVCRRALKDDIVGQAADLTEALAFNASSVFTGGANAKDLDQADVWNQIAADLDLDSRLREIWRTLFTDSQVVVATWWGQKEYKSRRPTEQGQAARKTWNLTVPLRMSVIDTTRVVPVGSMMFQAERLAFIASPLEADYLDSVLAARDGLPQPAPGRRSGSQYETRRRTERGMLTPTVGESGAPFVDPIVARLITSRYEPDFIERDQLIADGVDPANLYLFDDRFVFRHTRTLPFGRFAEPRLERVLELLDLKHQLRAMDRAHLIGGANYIVLITKGSDKLPAQQPEIANLQAHVKVIGQVPVMVGDHRLDVKIVTPGQDSTVSSERWATIDTRISATTYGTFAATGSDTEDPLKSGQVISQGLESARRMIRRKIETRIFQLIRDANPDTMTDRAKLTFHPGRIALSFDSAWATFLLDMREAREMSRGTLLEQMGLDQSDEAARMDIEAEHYDDRFGTIVPHGANPDRPAVPPDTEPPQRRAQQRKAARKGGNRGGGGAAPGTRQGKTSIDPRRSKTGPTKRPSPKAMAALAAAGIDPAEDATVADLVDELEQVTRNSLKAAAGVFEIPGRHQLRSAQLLEQITDALQADTDAQEGTDDDD